MHLSSSVGEKGMECNDRVQLSLFTLTSWKSRVTLEITCSSPALALQMGIPSTSDHLINKLA